MKQVPFCRPAWLSLLTLSLVFTFLMEAELQAQPRYYENWLFADRVGLNFSSGTPHAIPGAMETYMGNASISNPCTGELLFYTNGDTVWNRKHAIMQSGTGLGGSSNATQSSLIVPIPDDPTRYYIFTTDAHNLSFKAPNSINKGIRYSVVDVTGDNGLGSVIQKSIPLMESTTEKLVGVRHRNRKDFWVITYTLDSSEYHAWLVTSGGISSPVVSRIPMFPDGVTYKDSAFHGYLKASPDGRYLFSIFYGHRFGVLMEFDNATGRITKSITQLPSFYGASFSPNSRFLYTIQQDAFDHNSFDVVQYDLTSNEIGSSRKVLGRYHHDCAWRGYAMQIGTDRRIYFTLVPGNIISAIENPDLPNATYRQSAVTIPRGLQPLPGLMVLSTGLPNCIDGLFLTDTVVFPQNRGNYDTAICAGQSIQLRASDGLYYRWKRISDQWDPPSELSCLSCKEPTVLPLRTGTYVAAIGRPFGCDVYDTITVIVHEHPRLDAGEDIRLCEPGSIRLQASGGSSYQWDSSADLSCLNCSEPVANVATTTTYYLTARSRYGCTARDSVRIIVEPFTGLNAGNDTTLLPDVILQLRATGAARYRWDERPELSCLDCPDPLLRPAQTSTYYLTGWNAEGCEARDSITVTVTPVRDKEFVIDAGNDTTICPGTSIRLTANGGIRYHWEVSPDLSCLDCPDPTASPVRTTTYRVTGFNTDGDEARDSVTVVVRPEFRIDLGSDHTICAGEVVSLSVTGSVRRLWEPSYGLSSIDSPSPVASPMQTTTYTVTAWNAEGCQAVDSITLMVKQPEMLRIRIGRQHHANSHEPLIIPVELSDSISSSDITELDFELGYDPDIMIPDPESFARLLDGTLLEGWDVELREHDRGRLMLTLRAPVGASLSGKGDLLRFEARLYLSYVRGTEIPFRLRSSSRCITFIEEAGYAELDSICGLNFRLIEANVEKYVPPTTYPNPARDLVTFEFGLGLDGPTRLEVFDAQGHRVAVLLDEILQPGGYSLDWDVRELPAGVYWYRLTSGNWNGEGRLVVQQ